LYPLDFTLSATSTNFIGSTDSVNIARIAFWRSDWPFAPALRSLPLGCTGPRRESFGRPGPRFTTMPPPPTAVSDEMGLSFCSSMPCRFAKESPDATIQPRFRRSTGILRSESSCDKTSLPRRSRFSRRTSQVVLTSDSKSRRNRISCAHRGLER
jgi:hypothetical protein